MNAKEEIDRLTDELRLYQDKYYKEGISLISDSEYDRLTDRLMELEAAHPELAHPDSPTKRVGSDLTNDFPEVRHTIPVLSLDKAYSPDQVRDFFGKSIAKGGEMLSFAAEEKIDGVSMVLYYEDGVLVRAVTRGNGEVGNDVTANIMTMRSVPLSLPEPLTIAVRGEVYIAKADFEALNAREPDEAKRAANPRNLAAGTVRRQKSSEAKLVPLRIFCYEGRLLTISISWPSSRRWDSPSMRISPSSAIRKRRRHGSSGKPGSKAGHTRSPDWRAISRGWQGRGRAWAMRSTASSSRSTSWMCARGWDIPSIIRAGPSPISSKPRRRRRSSWA